MNTVEAQKTLAKRLLICFYAIVLVMGLVPINAWAEGDDVQDSTNQEQQASQNEGESAGDSGEKEYTEGSDSDKSGDTTADKGSGNGTDSSADKSKESKSTEDSDSSASKGSSEDNSKFNASNESEESADSSEQNGDDEEPTNDSNENALESTGENGISLASVGDDDQQPYLTYDHALTKQEVYDRLDTYYGFSPYPVHVYKATETGEQTGDELMTLAYYPWIDMTEKFPVDNPGLCRYYCRSTRFGWYGNIYLREKVNVSSPEQSYPCDGEEHKWVPEVKATVNQNFSKDDYTVTYTRSNPEVETTDFTSPGNIWVRIRGKGDYSYFYSVKIYTIEAKDNLTVTGSDYEGYYDGNSHGEAAVPSDTVGTTVEYSTDGGNEWSTEVPTVKNAGDSLKVDVRAHNDNYTDDATASYTLKVNKANINVLVAGDSKTDRTDPETGEVIESNAVTYDGQQHSVQGFTVKSIKGESSKLYPESNVALRDGVEAKAEGTKVGDYKMGLTADSFVNPDTNFNVTYLVDDGVLTIKPAEVTVSVTGKSDTQTYNGAEQSVSGFEVTDVEGDQAQLYSTDKVALADGVAAVAEGIDAGTYDMGLTKESFVNNDSNFNVSFNVTDGSLTIDKRALELNDSASFVYNGKEQVLNIDASKVTGLVDGDRLNLFNAQVKGTEPGTYDEVSEYAWDVINDELNVTKNYTLNVTGALTITEADSSADADADSDGSDSESSDAGSDAGSDSETPQTGDFAQFAMGSALAAAIAALGALLATRRFRGERL